MVNITRDAINWLITEYTARTSDNCTEYLGTYPKAHHMVAVHLPDRGVHDSLALVGSNLAEFNTRTTPNAF